MPEYNHCPKTRVELAELIEKLIAVRGINANLNDIDVSLITDLSYSFYNSNFNGDISKWNVSKVENMNSMFYRANFTGDISEWDVSNVIDMRHMFCNSPFNQDISKWDVSKVTDMDYMFYGSKFNRDISNLIKLNPKIINGIHENTLIYEKVKFDFPEYFL